jgi:hypothetical protein
MGADTVCVEVVLVKAVLVNVMLVDVVLGKVVVRMVMVVMMVVLFDGAVIARIGRWCGFNVDVCFWLWDMSNYFMCRERSALHTDMVRECQVFVERSVGKTRYSIPRHLCRLLKLSNWAGAHPPWIILRVRLISQPPTQPFRLVSRC